MKNNKRSLCPDQQRESFKKITESYFILIKIRLERIYSLWGWGWGWRLRVEVEGWGLRVRVRMRVRVEDWGWGWGLRIEGEGEGVSPLTLTLTPRRYVQKTREKEASLVNTERKSEWKKNKRKHVIYNNIYMKLTEWLWNERTSFQISF